MSVDPLLHTSVANLTFGPRTRLASKPNVRCKSYTRSFKLLAFLIPVLLAVVVMLALPQAALAHHGIDGRTPATFGEGMISGLAHPVLGLDHLVFLLAAGLAAGALQLRLGILGLFIAASVAGLALHLARLDVPLAEAAVAATILALGLAAGSRVEIGAKVWTALFVVAGLCHGYAYGESIVGAPVLPLGGYLVGLGLVQAVLASATYFAGGKLADGVGHARPELRHLGALLAVIGIVFFFAALRTGA